MKHAPEQTGEMRNTDDGLTKVLVAGWFSFEWGRATAGDLMAGDLACEWLESAGVTYDVAIGPPFRGGVDWRTTNPRDYSHLVFVCGPFGNGNLEARILNRFSGCQIIGLDLTMLEHLDEWNPFDVLLERDSSAGGHPDIVFATHQHRVPVVGVILVEPYEGAMTHEANAAIGRLLDAHEVSVVSIDTRLDVEDRQGNRAGLRSPSEIESLISRMDMVVTTRLHGMVLALKNGIPAVAIDPQAGGAKIMRQANEIGWPTAYSVDSATDEALQEAFDYCLSAGARAKASECHRQATERIQGVRDAFTSVFVGTDGPSPPASPQPPRRWLRNQWHGTKFHSFAETLHADDTQRRRRRRRFQRLKKENQRLARRAKKLELQLHKTKRSRPQRILKKVGKLRAKVLKK